IRFSSALRYSRARPAARRTAATPSGPTFRSTNGMSPFVRRQLISPDIADQPPDYLGLYTKSDVMRTGFASVSRTGDLRSIVSLHRRTLSSGAGLLIVTVYRMSLNPVRTDLSCPRRP